MKVAEDLQGSLSLCRCVVPLRDSDPVINFKAASFCVAFFSSLLYIGKLTHLVNVITYNNINNNAMMMICNTSHSNNRILELKAASSGLGG